MRGGSAIRQRLAEITEHSRAVGAIQFRLQPAQRESYNVAVMQLRSKRIGGAQFKPEIMKTIHVFGPETRRMRP